MTTRETFNPAVGAVTLDVLSDVSITASWTDPATNEVVSETVYGGGAFASGYAGSSRIAISGGLQLNILRDGGFPEGVTPTLAVVVS